jgi:hypothetical protein
MERIMTDASAPAAPAASSAPTAPPTNAAEARIALDGKMVDKEWGAKLFSGDAATTTEYRSLQDLINRPDSTDAVAAAMSSADHGGIIQDSGTVELRGQAGYLRELGLNELQVKETLEGKEPTAAEVDMAARWKAHSFKSKEFVTRLMSGEPEARQQLLVANIILTSAKE